MNKKIATEVALGVIIIVAIVVGGAVWFSGNQKAQAPTQTAKTPQTVATDETAGWQTYRNEKYGFEFQYPKEFFFNDFIKGDVGLENGESVATHSLSMTNSKAETEGFIIQLSVSEDVNISKVYNFKISDIVNVKIIGENSWVSFSQQGMGNLRGYAVKRGSHYYVFSVAFEEFDNTKIEEILSTFKFLN